MSVPDTSAAAPPVWHNHSSDRLPGRNEALRAPLKAFPNWYLRLQCERCDRERYVSEADLMEKGLGDEPVRLFIGRPRHEGCGGRPQTVELVTNIPGISSKPIRRIESVAARDRNRRRLSSAPFGG
jgi:hypothetical protein